MPIAPIALSPAVGAFRRSALAFAAGLMFAASTAPAATVYPGAGWDTRTPAEAGLDPVKLDAIRATLGGRGCIVRGGCMVYTWGDPSLRADVASACKPWIAHFLFKAVEEGRLAGLDAKAADFEPCLNSLNSGLGFKDRNITFRHMANQISCYGVREAPGTAFNYNDYQMALFWDTLFTKVYRTPAARVDDDVLRPLLSGPMQCQDDPTFLAFGPGARAGRVAVSVRDFARFGLLYLRRGAWNGKPLLGEVYSRMAVESPLPFSIPRTAGQAAEMCHGRRSIGGKTIPDDQADHDGSYSFLWWVNGVRRNGRRFWPDAPADVYACLGHTNGKRGMAVMPSQQVVISWNDTTLDARPSDPHPLNEVFKLIAEGAAPFPTADRPGRERE